MSKDKKGSDERSYAFEQVADIWDENVPEDYDAKMLLKSNKELIAIKELYWKTIQKMSQVIENQKEEIDRLKKRLKKCLKKHLERGKRASSL